MPVRDRGRWMEKTTAAYRFGPPEAPIGGKCGWCAELRGVREGAWAGRGHPKITVYEIALEREAERYYGPD
jgi:hypothetical protein